MREKSLTGLFIISLFIISLLAGFASAQTNFESLADSLTEGLESIKLDPTYLTEILMGVLLFMIIYTLVSQLFNFGGRGSWILSGTVSLIVVLLTFVWLPEGYVEAIALQYSAMGATILTVVPFAIMIYFTLVVNKSLLFARITWLFYAMYYLTMFLYKIATAESGKVFTADNIPYAAALIVGIFIFFFIKGIRNLIFKEKLESSMQNAARDIAVRQANKDAETDEARRRFKLKPS